MFEKVFSFILAEHNPLENAFELLIVGCTASTYQDIMVMGQSEPSVDFRSTLQ